MSPPIQPPPAAPPGLYWFRPVALAVAAHLALMAAYALAYRGDVSALVCVNPEWAGRWPYEAVRVGVGEGFDGQFYYVLARDPWRRPRAVIDLPAVRHERILFPLLGWLLSGGGHPVALLWALPAINLACIGGLAGLGAAWAVRHGRSPLWGALLPVVLNAGAPALRDLTDPLAALAAAGLLVSWLLRRPSWQVGAWAAAAVFSRETNAAVVGIVLAVSLYRRAWRPAGWAGAALAAWAGWVLLLRRVYGVWPFLPGNLGAPFVGIAYRLAHLEGGAGGGRAPIHAVALGFLFLQMGLSTAMLFLRPRGAPALVALAGLFLAVTAGVPILMDGWSYTRVFLWMPLGVWLWGVQSGRRWPVWLLTPAALWPCFAVLQAWRH